jgi:hypothetical protein
LTEKPEQASFLPEEVFDFEIEQSDEPLIARAGLVLPHQMAKALGLPCKIDSELPAPGSPRGMAPSAFVMPILLMLHGGGKTLEDLRELRAEVSLQKLLKIRRFPASCTVGDWLRRMGKDGQGLDGLGTVNGYLINKVLDRDEPGDYVLDADATIIESEKEAAKWTYQKVKGYQPLLGFLHRAGDSADLQEGTRLPGLIVADEFREGNVPAGAKAVAFLKRCAAMLPAGKKLYRVRGDSAWYQAAVFNCCRELKSGFAICADLDKAVREAILGIKSWSPYHGDRQIGETVHTMNGTKEAFRLIVLRWPKEQADLFDQDPYFYHAIATDGDEAAEEVVAFYDQRGEIENWIKELKEGFGMDWMPCGESYANAVYFRLGVIAYNLFVAMKSLSLPNRWRHHRIATVRWRLYQIAGQVFWESRRVRLMLATTIDKVRILFQAGKRVQSLAAT